MTLLPYHKFEYDGNTYVFNPERVRAGQVSEATSVALDELSSDPAASVAPEVQEELDRLDLFSTDGLPAADTYAAPPCSTDSSKAVTWIELLIAQTCNLRCAYCYGGGGEYGRESLMDEATAARAIDWMLERSGDAKRLGLHFFGGEPLLNFPVLQSTLEYANRRGQEAGKQFRHIVTTNATLLDHDIITYFRDNDVRVKVSFDGPPDIHDANRRFTDGTGSYEVVRAKTAELLSAMPPGTVACRATVQGTADPARMREAIEAMGFHLWKLTWASPSTFNDEDRQTFPPALMADWENQAKGVLAAIKGRDPAWTKALRGTDETTKAVVAIALRRKRRFFCGVGRTKLGISASGDVFPCHRLVGADECKMGSIFGGELNREPHRMSRVIEGGVCAECWAKYLCGGGCTFDHFMRTGSMSQPCDVTCQHAKFIVELAVYLYCQLDKGDQAFMAKTMVAQKGVSWT